MGYCSFMQDFFKKNTHVNQARNYVILRKVSRAYLH